MINQLKTTIPLAVVMAVLLGHQYLGATWSEPASSPTAGNVDAPINVGTADQVKNGGLSVDSFAVFGDAVVTGTTTADRTFSREYCDENGQNCTDIAASGGGSVSIEAQWRTACWGDWVGTDLRDCDSGDGPTINEDSCSGGGQNVELCLRIINN